MSEYQYYEFQVVDRSLTTEEMQELRSFSTRAEITPNRFVNEYSWGNFKGDEDRWMEKYFDGFLYYANGGTHVLKFALPAELLDYEEAQIYCHDDYFKIWRCYDKVILDFLSESEETDEWEDDYCLSSFLSLRNDLICGDFRCLYLGWLSGLQYEECDEDRLEPPVPPGLKNLSPTLIEFAKYLRISPDLLQAGASQSPSIANSSPQVEDLRLWLSTLSSSEKDHMLEEILAGSLGGDNTVAFSHTTRFLKVWRALKPDRMRKCKKRTGGQLLSEAEIMREKRLRIEAMEEAAALEEQERLQKIVREKRLSEIKGCEPILWNQVEKLVAEKKPKSYDRALEILVDLRDLAAGQGNANFSSFLSGLRERHSTKSSFIRRLEENFGTKNHYSPS